VGEDMITIIDYNMGNIASIKNMLKKIGYEAVVTSDPAVIECAKRIILPGVGAFDYGMKNLKDLGLIDVIKGKVLDDKVPFLGICLGMQLLTSGSEEGLLQGLRLINANTKKFTPCGENMKIPHMGWNYVTPIIDSALFKGVEQDMRFYFVHSYYVDCHDKNDSLANTSYGVQFTSVVGRENILGVQFHPEKSHKYGMKLLKNFVEMF
jgi:glutamine amidotransferase